MGASDEAQDATASAPEDKPAKQPNLAVSVDDINFFGGVGGGQLTREGIRNAGRTMSPAILAEEELSKAVQKAGGNRIVKNHVGRPALGG